MRIGVAFLRSELLLEAITHPTYNPPGGRGGLRNYQRLEFIGDGILGMVVAVGLFRHFPNLQEGGMTQRRQRIVSNEALGAIGEGLGLFDGVLMMEGARKAVRFSKPQRRHICACVLEAVIGAIYLDQGLSACEAFIERVVVNQGYTSTAHEYLSKIKAANAKVVDAAKVVFANPGNFTVPIIDPVSSPDLYAPALRKALEQHSLPAPRYSSLRTVGRDMKGASCVGCYICDTLVAQGFGESHAIAKFAAAKKAVETIGTWWPRS